MWRQAGTTRQHSIAATLSEFAATASVVGMLVTLFVL
jgi:hypothetical protein